MNIEKLKELLPTIVPPHHQEIISMLYGLKDGICHSKEETAAYYNITIERINLIEAKIERRIRHPRTKPN